MKGTYKVYNKAQNEWIDLCRYFTPGVKTALKIEDGYLWSSDDGKTWKRVVEVGIDNKYLEDNFVKKNNNDSARLAVNDDEDPNITSSIECWNSDDIHEVIIEATGYRGLSGDVYPKSTVYVGHTDNGSEIKLSVYDEDEYSNYQNELSISAFDGVKINGSDVITKDTVDESGILTTNEDGVVNKSELTIGSFEIKNDKPYNYALEGHYEPDDWSKYTDESVMDCIFTAEYNHEGAKLYYDASDNNYWAYEFVVTDAEIYVSYENEGAEDYKWIPCDKLGNNVLPIPVDILDNLVFTDGVADVEENISIYVNGVDDYISDAKIRETTPFSLKSTSKALLNGSPVITAETLEKSDIVSNLNNRISQVDTKIDDLTLRLEILENIYKSLI